MSSSLLSTRGASERLTRASLLLLDLPFEPATACAGEVFDHVVEQLSEQLSRCGAAVLADTASAAFVPPAALRLDPAITRRAQGALRESIAAGRLPGNGASLRACSRGIEEVGQTLRQVGQEQGLSASASELVTEIADTCARLRQVVGTYEHGYARLARAVAQPGQSRGVLGDSATRAERALVRTLGRVGLPHVGR